MSKGNYNEEGLIMSRGGDYNVEVGEIRIIIRLLRGRKL